MLLVRILESNQIDAYFRSGFVKISFAPQGLEIGKTHPQLIFNNPRSSILPENAPDPKILLYT